MRGRIVVLAVGTRGDTLPYVALADGLRDAGYRVRVACDAAYRDLVTGKGLEHAALETVHEVAAFGGMLAQRPDRPAAIAAELFQARRMMTRIQHGLFAQMRAACEDADAVVCSLIGAAGYAIARQRGVPCILTQLQPIWPTRAFPASIGWSRQTGRPYPNLLSHLVVEQGLWQMMRPTRGSRRGQVTALPRTPLASPFAHARRLRLPVLLGFSPAVQPPPPDWPDHVHVTGCWFLDPPPRWSAPDELAGFLSAGPPPVYVGFASWHNDTQASHVIRAALRLAGLRGIVLGDTRRDTSTEEVLVVDEVPHAWLFPQMAAVVHHGGAGTTAVGLRAGVPTVVCSFIGDQSYWGSRVHALGAGPPPIPIRRLTPDRLAQALGHATRDPSFRTRAAALGAQIRAEDGVTRAVKLITEHLPG